MTRTPLGPSSHNAHSTRYNTGRHLAIDLSFGSLSINLFLYPSSLYLVLNTRTLQCTIQCRQLQHTLDGTNVNINQVYSASIITSPPTSAVLQTTTRGDASHNRDYNESSMLSLLKGNRASSTPSSSTRGAVLCLVFLGTVKVSFGVSFFFFCSTTTGVRGSAGNRFGCLNPGGSTGEICIRQQLRQ